MGVTFLTVKIDDLLKYPNTQTLNYPCPLARMVNTFVTRYPLEDAISDLDDRRLGKQRVEAYQILNILLDADAIAGFTITSIDTFRKVYSDYKSFLKSGGQPLLCYHFDNGERSYGKPTYSYVTERKVTGGFSSHPMVLMWVGYTEGLRYYLNLCILEWVARGRINNMTVSTVFVDESRFLPAWVQSASIHKSHCAALLRKEAVRDEPTWYWAKPHIYKGVYDSDWYYSGYLWLRTDEERARPEHLITHCDPIRNDFI